MNILASFDYVNKTDGYRIGSDGVVETRFETKGELYKFCLKEYGRPVSRVFITKNGKDIAIGWAFEKLVKYTDCKEKYLQETWVSIHEAMPETKTTYHYAEL